MRKIYLFITLLFIATININAQILRAEELEEYAKEKYGEKWNEAAANLAKELALDKNKALTYVQVIEAPEKSKEDLYLILNYWYTNTFKSGKAVIELNDKESGVIIAKGHIENIASHTGGMNSYMVHLTPVIKTDIKDGKIRVTYTVPYYTIEKIVGGGILSGVSEGLSGVKTVKKVNYENWVLDKCYPFAEKDKHKKTSSKSLIMAHAYSNVLIDKIEEAIKNGVIGNENEDW